MVRWSHALMVRWSHAHMVRWSHVHMVGWSHVHMVKQAHAHMVRLSHAHMIRWSRVHMVRRSHVHMVRTWSDDHMCTWSDDHISDSAIKSRDLTLLRKISLVCNQYVSYRGQQHTIRREKTWSYFLKQLGSDILPMSDQWPCKESKFDTIMTPRRSSWRNK